MGLIFRTEKEQEEEEQRRRRCHLLWLRETGNKVHVVIDPMDIDYSTKRELQSIHLPQLNFPIQCLASNHGWLLILSRTNTTLFFFNPFTQAKLALPYRRSLFQAATFTTSPASQDCVIYAVEHSGVWINISMLRMGEERPMWENYWFREEEFATVRAVAVSANGGKLWCVDCLGRVGVFESGVWRVVCGVKSEKVRSFEGVVEVGGELVVGMRGRGGLGEVYGLKESSGGGMGWEKIGGGELGGGVYLGGIGGGVVEGVGREEGEVFFVDKYSGWCSVYGKESTGSGLKRKLAIGNPWLGQNFTPVWIHKSG